MITTAPTRVTIAVQQMDMAEEAVIAVLADRHLAKSSRAGKSPERNKMTVGSISKPASATSLLGVEGLLFPKVSEASAK